MPLSGSFDLPPDAAHHASRVLRLRVGDAVEIFDGTGHECRGLIAELSGKRVTVANLTATNINREAPLQVVLAQALCSSEKMDWVIQKATELGVTQIVPMISVRTERGLDKAAPKRLERWRRIGLEASQQSRRAHLPEIAEPASWEDVLATAGTYRYALDENGTQPLPTMFPVERRADDSVALLIGPEGGWTTEERSEFTAAGWAPVSLGPSILRAETAALAALAIVSAAWLPPGVATLKH